MSDIIDDKFSKKVTVRRFFQLFLRDVVRSGHLAMIWQDGVAHTVDGIRAHRLVYGGSFRKAGVISDSAVLVRDRISSRHGRDALRSLSVWPDALRSGRAVRGCWG